MKKKRRESELAAVIDIGSRSVRMDILEFAADERPTLLETLRREVDLGREVFRTGEVPPGEIALLCDIAADFRRKLDEYGPVAVHAYATSALREAANRELVADRIRAAGGWRPEILESSRECHLAANAMRRAASAAGCSPNDPVLGLHVGAGSLFMVFFSGGTLCFGEEIPAGRDRLPATEDLRVCARAFGEAIAASGAERRLRAAAGEKTPPCLFVSGSGARRMAAAAGKAPAGFDDVVEVPLELLRDSHADDAESACAMMATAFMTNSFGCEKLFVPGFTTRGAFLEEADSGADDARFAADLAGVCRGIVRRFAVDPDAAERRANLAAALWKKLRARFDPPERSLALLECAARLRDLGAIVDCRETARHSAYFIDHLQLPGVADAERRLVAAAVRFAGNGGTAPERIEKIAPALRSELFRTAALLRTAAILAEAPADRFSGMRLNIAGGELIVTPRSAATGAERAALAAAAGLFVRVFGLTPRIGEASL